MPKDYSNRGYEAKDIIELFSLPKSNSNVNNPIIAKSTLLHLEATGQIPKAGRKKRGKVDVRFWTNEQLSLIGEKVGFFKKPKSPKVITFYVQKGGTGKTPLAYNLSRTLALHNLKVLTIGIDSQETITTFLSGKVEEPDHLPDDLNDFYKPGLLELFTNKVTNVDDIIAKTDLPNLHYIPENAGLAELENEIAKASDPLNSVKKRILSKINMNNYDFIIFDCNPYWGRTVNSFLKESDIIISPLACNSASLKITQVFFKFLDQLDDEIILKGERLIIPTLLKPSKLSRQVRNYYETNYSDVCSKSALKESVIFDESLIFSRSVGEYSPESQSHEELKQFYVEIQELINFIEDADLKEKQALESLNIQHSNVELI